MIEFNGALSSRCVHFYMKKDILRSLIYILIARIAIYNSYGSFIYIKGRVVLGSTCRHNFCYSRRCGDY